MQTINTRKFPQVPRARLTESMMMFGNKLYVISTFHSEKVILLGKVLFFISIPFSDIQSTCNKKSKRVMYKGLMISMLNKM